MNTCIQTCTRSQCAAHIIFCFCPDPFQHALDHLHERMQEMNAKINISYSCHHLAAKTAAALNGTAVASNTGPFKAQLYTD